MGRWERNKGEYAKKKKKTGKKKTFFTKK